MKTSTYEYESVYFRNTHYSSAEEAKSKNALHHWTTTYGYSSTMDAFTNTVDLICAYDPTAIEEFTFIFTIDGVVHPPMNYREVFELLNKSVI